MNLIFKYVLFGYDKVKDEKVGDNEKPLLEFIKDLESVNIKFYCILLNNKILLSKFIVS